MIRSGKFIAKEVGSDLMCYDTDKDEVHILNSTARAIHSLLSEGKTEEQIIEALWAASRVPERKELEADVRACIKGLMEKGLVDESLPRQDLSDAP